MAVGKALRWNADVWQVKIEGSATQWGVQALASRRAPLLSDFAALAVGGYLLASNRKASHKLRCSDTPLSSFGQLYKFLHNLLLIVRIYRIIYKIKTLSTHMNSSALPNAHIPFRYV
jgi:hypothetical protein